MYSASYTLNSRLFVPTQNAMFAPFLKCYQIQNATLLFNGLLLSEGLDFEIQDNYIKLLTEYSYEPSDHLVLNFTYFYKSSTENIFDFIINNTYPQATLSNKIASLHYIEAQFSLDNGLYKNAALNFGTVLEALLNVTLANIKLYNLIQSYQGNASQTEMHQVREFRNLVHPERISATTDITRTQAVHCRNLMESILKNF